MSLVNFPVESSTESKVAYIVNAVRDTLQQCSEESRQTELEGLVIEINLTLQGDVHTNWKTSSALSSIIEPHGFRTRFQYSQNELSVEKIAVAAPASRSHAQSRRVIPRVPQVPVGATPVAASTATPSTTSRRVIPRVPQIPAQPAPRSSQDNSLPNRSDQPNLESWSRNSNYWDSSSNSEWWQQNKAHGNDERNSWAKEQPWENDDKTPVAEADNEEGHKAGDRVEVRDKGKDWKAGVVQSVFPIRVLVDNWDKAYVFDEVRKPPAQQPQERARSRSPRREKHADKYPEVTQALQDCLPRHITDFLWRVDKSDLLAETHRIRTEGGWPDLSMPGGCDDYYNVSIQSMCALSKAQFKVVAADTPALQGKQGDLVKPFVSENRLSDECEQILRKLPASVSLRVIGAGRVLGQDRDAILAARIRRVNEYLNTRSRLPEVDEFLEQSWISAEQEKEFRRVSASAKRLVMEAGPIIGENPTKDLIERLKKAKAQTESVAAKAPVKLQKENAPSGAAGGAGGQWAHLFGAS